MEIFAWVANDLSGGYQASGRVAILTTKARKAGAKGDSLRWCGHSVSNGTASLARTRHHPPGEGSVFEPRPRILFRVQTSNRRHGPCSQAVTVENAHAAGPFYGPTGLGVE